MIENFTDYIINSSEMLHFEILALDVYADTAKQIAEDSTISDFQEKRKKLYREIESQFDSTKDDFVRLVIAYSLISGTYFMQNGLNLSGKLDSYSGKRYTEFVSTVVENAMDIVKKLVDKEVQYRLATSLIGVALKLATKKDKDDIATKISKLIYQISFDDDNSLSVKKTEFLIPAINFLVEDRKFRTQELVNKIDRILTFAVGQGDTAESERSKFNEMGFDCIFPPVFELKIKYYQKLDNNNKTEINEVRKKFAMTYEKLAKSRREMGEVHLLMAVEHYEKAVKIYSKYGFTGELKIAKKLLDETKQELEQWDNPHSISSEHNLMDYLSEEERIQSDKYLEEFEKLNINEQIQILLLDDKIVPFISKGNIFEFRAMSKKINQFSEIFPVTIVDEKGHTVFLGDSEERKESYALYRHIQIAGVAFWTHALLKIFEKKVAVDFTEIFESDELLSKRCQLFNKAYELFFCGDVYSALYILVPQVEWWFREIAYQAGEQISNLKYFPIEQAKTLTPIFETQSLKEYLGEDCHWLFEQLMTKEPMNVRNKIAHGLELNDNGYCAYFALCVLKTIVNKNSVVKEMKEDK